MLLSSSKFQSKAQEVVKEGLENEPIVGSVEKRQGGGKQDGIELENVQEVKGGMMLYTSGTTSRPVSRATALPGRNWQSYPLRKAYFCQNRW